MPIDPSKLMEVASAIKHGHVLPWTKLREYWAENPITNVGLFGLLVTTWAGFLSVRTRCGPGTNSGLLFSRAMSMQLAKRIGVKCHDY